VKHSEKGFCRYFVGLASRFASVPEGVVAGSMVLRRQQKSRIYGDFFYGSPLTDSNRRPLLTMRSTRQLVATDGSGFGVIAPFSRLRDLPPLATGCDHGAP
jgi:hypothetical protein